MNIIYTFKRNIYIYLKVNSFICFLSKFDKDSKLDEDTALEIQNQGNALLFWDSGRLQ